MFVKKKLIEVNILKEQVKNLNLEGQTSFSSKCPLYSGMTMDFEQYPSDFGMLYYRSLLQAKWILYADLMKGERRKNQVLVETYASHILLCFIKILPWQW